MNTPNPEVERIRNYLVAQAQKLSVAELVDKARRDSLPLREVAAAMSPAQFAARPAPAAWSAAEVWAHILAMTEHGARAIEGIIAQGATPPRVNDIITAATHHTLHTASDYWAAYTARRELCYARVLPATGDEHLDVKITHATFGELNWREWLLFMRVHDLDHLRQLQALVQAQTSEVFETSEV